VIATLSREAKAKGMHTVIITSDKDILQLVDKDVEVFSPYKDEGVTYNEEKVRERLGVSPKQIADLISLMGDSVDNIPGISGIGEKTASALIQEFGSVDKLLADPDKVGREKLRSAIKENIQKIKLNKELAVLVDDVDLGFGPEELKMGQADLRELARLFKRLEFKKFLKELKLEDSDPVIGAAAAEWEAGDLQKFIESKNDLLLYGEDADNLVFYEAGKTLRLAKNSPEFKNILADPKINKISHDLKKIKVNLARQGFKAEGLSFDTMIAAYLLNPSQGNYSLESVTLEHLNKMPQGKVFPAQEALVLIAKLKTKLAGELKEKKLDKLFYETEMPLVGVLAEMEELGIKLDLKLFKKLSQDLETRLEKLVKDIYKASGAEFNINSPKQLGVVLFEKLKLPVIKKTKTGPSTDEDVLNRLADKHKLPALLLEYRQLTKLKTTYIDVLPELADKDSRIHTSFNQTGTETGRLSSSNPNLQNIPIKTDIGAKIRKAIIAGSRDNYLVSCDYSQIDLRVLAHLSGDKHLISAFKQGLDIHRATAALIYGVEEKEISVEMRDRAKRVNFGIVYGLTAYGLARDLGVGFEEAQSFIDAYFTRYPGVKEYIEKQIKLAQKQGFVTTILGRRRYIPEISSRNQGVRQFAERQAVNTPIQGSSSDLIKLAMISIDQELKKKKLDSRMVLQIHDELLFDLPKGELRALTVLARQEMENVLKLDVPVKVDVKKGHNWLEMEEVK
jgi:DNA polymerase-1